MSKTKEQLAEDKEIALSFRVKPLEIEGLSVDKLRQKAQLLWDQIVQLESDKYDLEERQKRQDYDVSRTSLYNCFVIWIYKKDKKRILFLLSSSLSQLEFVHLFDQSSFFLSLPFGLFFTPKLHVELTLGFSWLKPAERIEWTSKAD